MIFCNVFNGDTIDNVFVMFFGLCRKYIDFLFYIYLFNLYILILYYYFIYTYNIYILLI